MGGSVNPWRCAARPLMAAFLTLLPAGLHAQAFVQRQGEGRVIVTAIYSDSDRAFNANGRSVPILGYEKVELYAAGEYGLTDDLTLLLTPSYRSVSVAGDVDTRGLNFVEAGARYRIGEAGGTTFSLQGTVRVPGATRRDALGQVGNVATEIDLRGQAGAGFGPNGAAGFVIGELGYRIRTEDPPDEFHADLTLGLHLAPRWTLIANSYNTISNGRGRGVFTDYRYHNLYLGLVHDVSPTVAVQAGGLATLAGKNALRERGLFGGFWLRF